MLIQAGIIAFSLFAIGMGVFLVWQMVELLSLPLKIALKNMNKE